MLCRTQLFSKIAEALFLNLGNLGIGAVLLLAAQAMRVGTFTVGDFALFSFYMTWVTGTTSSIGSTLAGAKQSSVALERLSVLDAGSACGSLNGASADVPEAAGAADCAAAANGSGHTHSAGS